MTNSVDRRTQAAQKRRRLAAAAARVLHEQGVERTTLADIAREAGVPAGNVYYYFKTKDELVRAALGEHRDRLDELTAGLDRLPAPRDRLKALVETWVAERETTARFGCPTGTLAAELGKRADGTPAAEAGAVLRRLLDWTAAQFRAWGVPDPEGHALTLVSAHQGMSALTHALRDPSVTTREATRLLHWLDSLPAGPGVSP
ncbi:MULTISPECIES: TetR/AcrR family transcriptional regulator [Streptomyces]|uniref:TetR/AcrR family transcriptional regulator n=1 Tax=Streptomyces eurythermus TaxID=42237 RepID=A0ABW6Z9T3_9ACTN|nr:MULTISPECIES: TetR/AcrR family transcriptional regulator [Streptomyces]QIS72518.1 TetR/AcrR family transcriptional regulator [Streptomyces sp. DSM 40868]WDM16893.1 helix-turn-helix transcriptional regulator [Streptomyces lavenduligriseus]